MGLNEVKEEVREAEEGTSEVKNGLGVSSRGLESQEGGK
jgi:hypothetical protein